VGSDCDELVESIGVVRKDIVKPSDLGDKRRVIAETKKDHPLVRQMPVKHKLPKVLVVRNEDALLCDREREDLSVWDAAREITTDTNYVVAKGTKVGNEAGISALVEEKPHARARAGGASLG
jgi:hypothetical protein